MQKVDGGGAGRGRVAEFAAPSARSTPIFQEQMAPSRPAE